MVFAIIQFLYLLRISNETQMQQQEALVQLQAQKELVEKANNDLLHSNAQMEEFAYTVSHDLKAPLVSVQGFSSYLKADTDELLDPQLHQEDVKILIETELLDTHADRIRVIQIFQNLITNAIKYDKPSDGPHEIKIKAVEEDGMVRFSVSDNGPGIDPDSQEQVFGVFKRLQTDGEGAGIGLSTVSRAVCQHGGRAWVESVHGNRATFCFTLPRYNIDSERRYPVEERKTTVA